MKINPEHINPEHSCEFGCQSLSCEHQSDSTKNELVDEQQLIVCQPTPSEVDAWNSLQSLAEFESWIDSELEKLETHFERYITKNSRRKSYSR